MNYTKYKYKVIILHAWGCNIRYGESLDDINAKIEHDFEKLKNAKAKIYINKNIYKHPALTDWELVETKEAK